MVSQIINEKCEHSAEHNKLDYQSIKINVVIFAKSEIPFRIRQQYTCTYIYNMCIDIFLNHK